MKKTPWFPANVKPIHDGIYECNRLECGAVRVTRMLRWTGSNAPYGWTYTDDGVPSKSKPGEAALMFKEDGDKWRGIQGDDE
ncbi:hypothetical protein [Burkholderia latens]|uniref:hypothetical protein n=1 Tax=Burkholderia latens TaxID=488446 RepID=UPI001AEA92C8|nr:hypothetical protein [Burkholderia latens]QTO46371.1 hypothetical protein J8I85_18170 [Burkholderia latens]